LASSLAEHQRARQNSGLDAGEGMVEDGTGKDRAEAEDASGISMTSGLSCG
jgi:hypothetical protein